MSLKELILKRRMRNNMWISLGVICAFGLGFSLCAIFTQNKIVDLEEELRMSRNIKKGIWTINSDGYYPYCSECGYEPPYVSGKDMRTPYCAKCGAEMDGRREE